VDECYGMNTVTYQFRSFCWLIAAGELYDLEFSSDAEDELPPPIPTELLSSPNSETVFLYVHELNGFVAKSRSGVKIPVWLREAFGLVEFHP